METLICIYIYIWMESPMENLTSTTLSCMWPYFKNMHLQDEPPKVADEAQIPCFLELK